MAASKSTSGAKKTTSTAKPAAKSTAAAPEKKVAVNVTLPDEKILPPVVEEKNEGPSIEEALAASEPMGEPLPVMPRTDTVRDPEEAPALPPLPPPKAEQATISRRIKEDDRIMFQIPPDPRGEIPVWERTINGKLVRLNAGRFYSMPQVLVELVQSQVTIAIKSAMTMAEFTSKNGKKIG